MKRKMLFAIVWILITVLHVLNMRDFGRSLGAQTQSAFEYYSDAQNKSSEDDPYGVGKLYDGWSYSYFHNLTEEYRSSFTAMTVFNCIYLVLTLTLFYFGVVKYIPNDSIKKLDNVAQS